MNRQVKDIGVIIERLLGAVAMVNVLRLDGTDPVHDEDLADVESLLQQFGCDGHGVELSSSHFENQLHHRAHSESSRTGGVDLVPNGVTVHLEPRDLVMVAVVCFALAHLTLRSESGLLQPRPNALNPACVLRRGLTGGSGAGTLIGKEEAEAGDDWALDRGRCPGKEMGRPAASMEA
ncbi:hypothetical protein FQN60_006866 [Etheostoma spectabile]|uniref:Uncharacterized protein n=1 Tax=Etheostoma spectabile TaxID=54343 RepID=A0A5J5CFJ1_9PERO|nr:hypothetical protein FQN60_006866 [Etheostoma spectabile]